MHTCKRRCVVYHLSMSRKLDVLSAISRDVAQVFFASVFVGPVVSGQATPFLIFSGLVLSVLAWLLSVGFVND